MSPLKVLGSVGIEAASSSDDEEPEVVQKPIPPPSPISPARSEENRTVDMKGIRYYDDPEKFVPKKIVSVFEYNGMILFQLEYEESPST